MGGSVQKSAVSVVAVIGALWLAGCMSLPLGQPQGTLEEQIDVYREQAVALRGLALTNSVAIEQETRPELLLSLEQELDKEENRKTVAELELVMHRLRLLPPDASLREAFLKLMQQEVSAYYDPEKKRLVYIASGDNQIEPVSPLEAPRFIYTHEFCHALEDCHYNLEALSKSVQHDIDSSLALTSFSEGTAVLIGVDALLDGGGLPTGSGAAVPAWLIGWLGRTDLEASGVMQQIEGVPPFLVASLLRPYLDGTVFSNRLRRDLGWRAIDAAYTARLPQTTAEILFPQRRYLKHFTAAHFEPSAGLLPTSGCAVVTNRLGAMGTALWLNGESLRPPRYRFLPGWLGDQLYIVAGKGDTPSHTIWLSLWEHSGAARGFARHASKRFASDFADASWEVARRGRIVAVVWGEAGELVPGECTRLVKLALESAAHCDSQRRWLTAKVSDLPWPLRFSHYPQHSSGIEVLGGYALEACGGRGFYRTNLVGGALRAESNPERHDYGLAWGLLRHTGDKRLNYTYWKVPLLMAWHSRGNGAERRLRWRVLWGLLADGSAERTRIMFVPVYHHAKPERQETAKVSGDGRVGGGCSEK